MTKKEREKLERRILLERKQAEDEETLAHYEARLRQRKKHYMKSATAFSYGGRKNRALAIGGCVLQLMEQLEKDYYAHHFLPGTLSWIINEDRTADEAGRKGYRCEVAYHALADEQSLTDEEIRQEMEETRKKIEAETAEMFRETEEE